MTLLAEICIKSREQFWIMVHAYVHHNAFPDFAGMQKSC